MNQKSDDSARTAKISEAKAPGRTIGFTIMSVVILSVAFWMNEQASLLSTNQPAEDAVDLLDIDGFSSDVWYLPDDELFGFVEIPAGSFIMGSNPALDRMAYENERWSDLRRQGSIDLPRFYISRFETTVAQFNSFVNATGFATETNVLAGPGNNPVANITWPETLAYARWLEQQLRQSPQTPAPLKQLLDDGAHVTLPSEAEWEKAARGTDGRVFPWGTQSREGLANFNNNALRPVGAVACSQCSYGLSDMAGNVWELTRSPLQDYPYDSTDDGDNLADDALWVMRGGGYSDGMGNVRTAVRGAVDPGVRNPTIGFRLVISSL
jgi:formylglycine-generating enzyme required for sulfatase activity